MGSIDVTCPGCGEEFEAGGELAGQTLDCPECGAKITVPKPKSAPAKAQAKSPAKSPAKAPPPPDEDEEIEEGEFEPEEASPSRGRKKAAPGSAGREGARRASSKTAGRKPSGRKTGPGGSKKLVIGLCSAGVVLIIAIALIAVVGGGGKSGDGDKGGKGNKEGGPGGSGSGPTKEGRSKYEKALAEAQGAEDPALWTEAGNAAETAGMKDEAKAAWEKALECKKDFKPALKKLGYRQYSLSSEAGEYELAGGRPFAELEEYIDKWLSPEDYAKTVKLEKEVIARIKADLQKRADNPFYDASRQVERVLATREGLNSRAWNVKEEKPYLVFEDKGPKGGKQIDDVVTERKLGDKLRMLKTMYKYLMERFFTPVGLKLDERNPLVIISLQDRKAFDDLHREMNMPVPPFALAYFHRIHKYIILYNGAFEGSGGSYLENKAASDGVVWHEGTHQVVNAVLNRGTGENTSESVDLPYWMNEGIAEYVGSLELEDDPDSEGNDVYKPGCLNVMRLREFWAALHPDRFPMAKQAGIKTSYAVDVERLLECHSHETTARAIAKMYKDPSEGEKAAAMFGTGLPYYQGTLFFYFCYNFENGKYAERFNKYLANSFKGFYYPENFNEAFKGVDLGDLTKEWFAYIEDLCKKHLR